MAKREPVGVGFRFSVSFQAIAWGCGLVVMGVGQYIGVCWLFWVCCRVVVCVCKGVGWEGKSNIGNGYQCYIYIRITQSANVKML